MTYAVRSATVRFGDTLALDDVTLEVEPGSVVAVVGGDGAGKSTLLRALVGRLALAHGQVDAPSPHEIGYLPATAGSWPALTVTQNMDFVGGIYGLSGAALTSRRDALLARSGLLDAADRLASQLSGGMRRKLGFSMAMLHDPRLLVLDEPSTGVDPVSRVDLWQLVSEAAAAGAAVVMSTTYLDEAERAAGLLALDGGPTLAVGTRAEVLARLDGTVARTATPHRRAWAWRRGREFHEYWPGGEYGQGDAAPTGTVVVPDLEDVVIALSLLQRHEDRRAS
ncbi:ABC transporter ATP-binding protein [Cellulomonas sp. P24]|uniref:ABC transporter ATP-binding protein n=1 Tax=Cellulomonas sp. P24 TaxID=2885206 RepID=UPI00216B51A1|nr:ABC transporter ATP-binding protein [Cellulomonas sp. P24]MCR6494395.1 ABC transporter ATP-binding protein [Cellulomonas sp. P24]